MARAVPGIQFDNIPPLAIRLEGDLDVPALRSAIAAVIDRHDVLRAVIVDMEPVPQQVITYDLRPALDEKDVSGEAKPDEVARAAVLNDASQPFSLRDGPLLRASVIKLGFRDHVFLFSMHHSVVDLWSMKLFLAECAEFYSSTVERRDAAVPSLRFQYADFAEWQRRACDDGLLETELAFWRQKLRGSEVVSLPFDRARHDAPTFAGAVHRKLIPRDLIEHVRLACVRLQVTPFLVYFAAMKLVLWTYSKQEDLVLGSAVSNRLSVDLESLIGHFAHTLPFRTNVSGDPTLFEILVRLRTASFEAQEHPHIPYWRIARELQRGPASLPLFMLQAVPLQWPHFSGLVMTPFETTGVGIFEGCSAPPRQYDVSWEMWTDHHEVRLVTSYRVDCFSPQRIEEIGQRFVAVTGAVATRPDLHLGELSQLVGAGSGQQKVGSIAHL